MTSTRSTAPETLCDEHTSARTIYFVLSGVMLAGCILLVGCDTPTATFTPNAIYAKRMELESGDPIEDTAADVELIIAEKFGTPDEPLWPESLEGDQEPLVSLENLKRAAGAISSDEADIHYGLYRKHCVLCHGQSGGGRGPTAKLLNPYPRDFRPGRFKYKSTALGIKPRKTDLIRTLLNGIPGTSMPGFHLLSQTDENNDIEALVDYVIYLSVRGESERKLLTEASLNLDYDSGDRLIEWDALEIDPEMVAAQEADVQAIIDRTIAAWRKAQNVPVTSDAVPEGQVVFGDASADETLLATSITNGKELFQSPSVGCSKCHGIDGSGEGVAADYDFWTKDWTYQAGLDPEDSESIAPMLELGAFKPRKSPPRNLTKGAFRGGGRPIDIYHRIVHGIEGTPMPAAALKPDNPQGLSESEIWDLVNFVLSIGEQS